MLNVAIIGHVDSGKTSLAKAISTQQSTAGFDKHPESQRRGITIDIGFSKLDLAGRQITLIDCPGHAHFIKSVLCGIYIADCAVVVVDGQKLLQQQTYESLIIAKVFKLPLILAISKCCKLSDEDRQKATTVVDSFVQKMQFSNYKIVTYDIHDTTSLDLVKSTLQAISSPLRRPSDEQLVFHYDHVFRKQGIGLVITGTIVRGQVVPGQTVCLGPTTNAKVSSIQSFGQQCEIAIARARVGICLKLSEKINLPERGVIVGAPSQFITARCFLVRLQNYQITALYRQGSIFTINFGYINFRVRVTVFQGSDVPAMLQQQQAIRQPRTKDVGFRKEYAVIATVDQVVQSLMAEQRFIILNLQPGVKQRICMGGHIVRALSDEQLTLFKEVIPRWQPVEVLRCNRDEGWFIVKEAGFPEGSAIYSADDNVIGTVEARFGMGKLRCTGFAEMDQKYHYRYEQEQCWQFVE